MYIYIIIIIIIIKPFIPQLKKRKWKGSQKAYNAHPHTSKNYANMYKYI